MLADKLEAALIARQLTGTGSDPPVAERDRVRASTLSSGCARRCWFWLTGAEKNPLSKQSAAAFDTGKALETGILDDLDTAMGHKAMRQVKADTDWFTGTADAVYPELGLVVDAKTANKDAVAMKQKDGGASAEYTAQLSLYMAGLGLKRAIVLYRNTDPRPDRRKPDSPAPPVYLVHEVEYDEMEVARLQTVAAEAYAGSALGVAPAAPAWAFTDWRCNYCDFSTACKKAD